MKLCRWSLLILLFPCLLGGQEADDHTGDPGAKTIFFNLERGQGESVVIPSPDNRPKEKTRHLSKPRSTPSEALSLRYWIELRGSEPTDNGFVTESRIFKSGEKIRFYFSSSTGGYIALAQRAKNGTLTLLFPNPERGLDDTRIKPSVDRILPSEKAWLRFDDKPSTERVVILFAESSKKLDALIQSAVRSEVPETVVEAQLGSKDLVLEVEDSTPSQIGTYLVSRDGRAVIRDIFLKHQ